MDEGQLGRCWLERGSVAIMLQRPRPSHSLGLVVTEFVDPDGYRIGFERPVDTPWAITCQQIRA